MSLIKKTSNNKRIWKGKPKHIKRNFNLIRKNIATKLCNPRLMKISLGSFRHYFGTMTYSKTKDIIYTQHVLGHKNIQNTLVYIHLVDYESDEWTCKAAATLKEAVQLIEAGFEFITEFDGKKLFRKKEMKNLIT